MALYQLTFTTISYVYVDNDPARFSFVASQLIEYAPRLMAIDGVLGSAITNYWRQRANLATFSFATTPGGEARGLQR